MSEVVIITGCSQGVGLGIASVYLRDGAQVIGCDLKPAPESLVASDRYVHVQGDLTDKGIVQQAIRTCLDRHGRIDTLVNNAGVGNGQPFEKTTDEDYERFYNINVRTVLNFSREALPHLKDVNGSIVNIASAFGLVGVAQAAGYVPTKYAVVGITRMLATEFGRDGVRVNAVAPGLVRSPGTEERIRTNVWWHRMMVEGTPLGRIGDAEEIGEGCLFLSSQRARFITGVVLPVDGGWSIAKFLPNPEL